MYIMVMFGHIPSINCLLHLATLFRERDIGRLNEGIERHPNPEDDALSEINLTVLWSSSEC